MWRNRHIIYKKNNLNKIKGKDISIRVQRNWLYSELNPQIVKLYFGYTLQDGYEIKYYSDEKSQNEVTNNNQVPGTVYFTIKAVNNDINWYGETKKLKLKLI